MVARGRERNVTFNQPDLFIAATAHLHALTVCTRNENDFRLADVPVLKSLVGMNRSRRRGASRRRRLDAHRWRPDG